MAPVFSVLLMARNSLFEHQGSTCKLATISVRGWLSTHVTKSLWNVLVWKEKSVPRLHAYIHIEREGEKEKNISSAFPMRGATTISVWYGYRWWLCALSRNARRKPHQFLSNCLSTEELPVFIHAHTHIYVYIRVSVKIINRSKSLLSTSSWGVLGWLFD